jgi:PAS domain-containing protein
MAPIIELILARSLAAHLAVPTFLADAEGRIVYFNEAAELLVGRAHEDTPELSSGDLVELLQPRGEDGEIVSAEQMPVPRALSSGMPAHTHAWSRGDGSVRFLATAIPLPDHAGDTIGALLFWYEEKA